MLIFPHIKLLRLFEGRFAKTTIGVLGLNIAEAGFGFLTAIVLVRLMGPSGYGVYSYAIALAGVFTIVGLLGQDKYIVRNMTKLLALGETKALPPLVLGVFSRVILLCFFIGIGAAIAIFINRNQIPEEKLLALWIAISVMILVAIMRIYIGLFQGLQKVITALYPDKLIRPLSFLLLAFVFGFISDEGLSAPLAVFANAIAVCIGLVVISRLWVQSRPYSISLKLSREYFISGWRPAFPFALLAGVGTINSNIDVIMLGAYVSDADIGIYRIASRVATLIGFSLVAAHAVVGPQVSILYTKGDFGQLQSVVCKAALIASVIALPCFIAFVFAGYWVLTLFGSEFARGISALRILSIGQLFNALAGSAGLMLMMTGHEKKAAHSLFFSTVLNVFLNFSLIPIYGAIGAAYATGAALVTVNLIYCFYVWRYLKINPTILGCLFKKH